MNGPYDEIIHLPHHVSKTRPRMSPHDRAAQFSPFAALTGYEESIQEMRRVTDTRTELAFDAVLDLDEKLKGIAQRCAGDLGIRLTWFVPDERKSGGSYTTACVFVKRVDPVAQILILTDGRKIPIESISSMEMLEE